ncbi:MAG: putative bicarbonate transporter, IctB family [Synechococcaceae cyanobacterium SM2_3_2]|nr:putative bicarbonate transporter, IctB family [Synechococcaceae cyanobacterium SM2_3_2]
MSGIQSFLFWQWPAATWWRHSLISRLTGWLGRWGESSLLVRWLDPLCLLGVAVYYGLASQASTGPLGLVLLGLVALLGLRWLTQPPAMTGIHLSLALVWLVATVATVFSPVSYAALDGWIKLTLYLLGFMLLHEVLQKPQHRSWLVGILLLISLGLGTYGLRQYFYGAAELATWVDPESGLAGTTRVYSYLRNPNLYGGYLVPLLPLGLAAMWRWSSWGWKLMAGFTTAVNLACLLLTYSRGAWIGGLVSISVMGLLLAQWMLIYLPVRWRRWTIPALMGGGILVLAVGILTLEPLRLRVLSMFQGRGDTSNNFRINVWMAVLDMIQDFPLLGIGPGNVAFNRVYPLYQRGNFSALGAYSVPLELTVEMGFVGLIAFAWFILALVAQAWQRWRAALQVRDPEVLWLAGGLAACAGVMAHGLVDTVWYRPQIQMVWWFVVALITSQLGIPAEPSLAAGDPVISPSAQSQRCCQRDPDHNC